MIKKGRKRKEGGQNTGEDSAADRQSQAQTAESARVYNPCEHNAHARLGTHMTTGGHTHGRMQRQFLIAYHQNASMQ